MVPLLVGLTRITTSLRRLPTQIPLLGHTCFLSCIYKPHILKSFYTFSWRSVLMLTVDNIKFHISNDKYEVCTCPCSCQISNIRYAPAVVKYQVCLSYCQIPGMPQLFSNIKYHVCPTSCQTSNIRYALALVKYQISGLPHALVKYQVCPCSCQPTQNLTRLRNFWQLINSGISN